MILHEKAAGSIDGYRYIDGIDVQEELNEMGDSVQRIVVTSGRRKKVLETAHSTISADHFGRKKTRIRIAKFFTLARLA